MDEYDYDELIEKIQTASKPNDEGKKVLIFLLSDPETDEYIQTVSKNYSLRKFNEISGTCTTCDTVPSETSC